MTVVEASVEEPETVRLVNAPVAAVIRFVNIELNVAKTDERPCELLVPDTVVELNDPVPPVNVLETIVLPAMVCAVTLVSVVDARVEEPDATRLGETIGFWVVSVPDTKRLVVVALVVDEFDAKRLVVVLLTAVRLLVMTVSPAIV